MRPVPEKIGKYEIVSVIGRGGMGVVYKAHDPLLDRFVAIKVILEDLETSAELRERFFREARACAKLNHPSIVTIFDFDEEHHRLYFVTELLDGLELKKIIAERRELTLETKVSIIEQACQGLAYAHSRGIVHRDVKPGNIVVLADGTIKILDFGIASMAGSSSATRSGMIMGTFRYVAPETLRGARDARSDIYSLGAVFYELLSYQPPHAADDLVELVEQLRCKEPVPLRQSMPTLPPELETVVARAMRKNVADRYQTFDEMLADLRALRKQYGAQLRTVVAPPAQHAAASQEPPPQSPASVAGVDDGDRTVLVSGTVAAPTPVAPIAAAEAMDDRTILIARPQHRPGATPSRPAARLMITAAADRRLVGRTVAMEGDEIVIGRDAHVDFVVDDHECSRRHASIRFDGQRFLISDLGSGNGTLLDGRPLLGDPVPLAFGAAIRIGETTLALIHAGDSTLPDLTGQTIDGSYRLVRCLRNGPKGAVYEARHGVVTVALEILSADLAAQPDYRERFEAELAAASKLRNPHICPLHGHGETELRTGSRTIHAAYLCYPMMSGGSLAARLAAKAPMTTLGVVGWIREISEALAHAHRHGVVHGNLKPTSIFFDDDDHAYVMGFVGAAVAIAGTVIGASAFMAPEQWKGEAATPKTDQFALAVLAYSLLSGRRPFLGQEDPETRARNFRRPPDPVHEEAQSSNRQGVPAAVSPVLQKALSTVPDQRYDSVVSFRNAFDAAVGAAADSGRVGESADDSMPVRSVDDRGSEEIRKLFGDAQDPRGGTSSSEASLPKIAISYRREDSLDITGRIFDRLAVRYGRENIFRDIDSINPGLDFRETINSHLESCDALLVVVGPRWFGETSGGIPRIAQEMDFVRHEVEAGLNKHMPVIPVLVGGRKMPGKDELPPSLKDFAYRQAVEVDSGRDFDHHMSGLIRAMDRILNRRN